MIKFYSVCKKLHYGWIVLIGCSLIIFYSMGLTINMFSIFLSPLIESLKINKTFGSSIITVQYAAGLAGMLLGDRLIQRFSVRKSTFICGLLIASGYFVFAFSESLPICYAATVLIGIGYGGGSLIPTSILINRWFHKKRGMALALAACGSGAATIIYPSIVDRIIKNNSLSEAFVFLGFSITILSLISFILIRDFPSDKSLVPYGEPRLTIDLMAQRELESPSFQLKTQSSNKKFIMLMFTAFITGMAIFPAVSHLAVFYTSSGYSTFFASAMLSAFGLIMLFGKPLYGLIIDHFGSEKGNYYIFSVWILIMVCGLLLNRGTVFAYLFIIFLGLGSALSTITAPIWIADLFGSKNYGPVYTYLRFFMTVGGTASMTLPGLCADIFESYTPILFLYLLLTIIAFILIQSLYKKYLLSH